MQNQIFKRILTQSNQIRTSYPTSALRSTQFQFQSSSSSNFSTSTRFNAREADRGSFEAPYSEASVPLYDRLAMHPVSFGISFNNLPSRTILVFGILLSRSSGLVLMRCLALFESNAYCCS